MDNNPEEEMPEGYGGAYLSPDIKRRNIEDLKEEELDELDALSGAGAHFHVPKDST